MMIFEMFSLQVNKHKNKIKKRDISNNLKVLYAAQAINNFFLNCCQIY